MITSEAIDGTASGIDVNLVWRSEAFHLVSRITCVECSDTCPSRII